MRPLIAALLLAASLVALLVACAESGEKQDPDSEVGGKTYIWEKEGFGGRFAITIRDDGTYVYDVGCLSSYIGVGRWTKENGILTLHETTGYDYTFRFSVGEGELVFLADGSDRFQSVNVADGDRFIETPGEEAPYVF